MVAVREWSESDGVKDPNALADWYLKHGQSEMNHAPDNESLRGHFSRLVSDGSPGARLFCAWSKDCEKNKDDGDDDDDAQQEQGALGSLVGLLTVELGSPYTSPKVTGAPGEQGQQGQQQQQQQQQVWFVHEFAVRSTHRGRGVGASLATCAVDTLLASGAAEVHTTVHADNVASRRSFERAGMKVWLTYEDHGRGGRQTTVLRAVRIPPVPAMRVIGVQSGNAVDGIDVGIFDFRPVPRSAADPRRLAGRISYTTVANATYGFDREEREFILKLRRIREGEACGADYALAGYSLGEWFAERVNRLLAESGIDRDSVDLVASHGQTVSGHPHWELGDLSVIAQRTGITVAGDFRPADVAAGGNGTPCTCTFDTLMLRPEGAGGKEWRICINIGGTSSVTFCPPREDTDAVPLGLDPGLGVFFMDLAARCVDPEIDFDRNGDIARAAKINETLLAHFLDHAYYKRDVLPIGVGPDDFPESLFREWRQRAQEMGCSDRDLLATLTELTARQIALACAKFGGPGIVGGACNQALCRGGITNNSFFIERLLHNLNSALGAQIPRIMTLEDVGLDEESWENAQYAIMGYLCFNNIVNFVPSCTGATHAVVGGRIAPGNNFAYGLLNRMTTN